METVISGSAVCGPAKNMMCKPRRPGTNKADQRAFREWPARCMNCRPLCWTARRTSSQAKSSSAERRWPTSRFQRRRCAARPDGRHGCRRTVSPGGLPGWSGLCLRREGRLSVHGSENGERGGQGRRATGAKVGTAAATRTAHPAGKSRAWPASPRSHGKYWKKSGRQRTAIESLSLVSPRWPAWIWNGPDVVPADGRAPDDYAAMARGEKARCLALEGDVDGASRCWPGRAASSPFRKS